MQVFKPHDLLDVTFEGALALKALHGLVDLSLAALLLILGPARINNLAVSITQPELNEDPHDFIATHLLHWTHELAAGAAAIVAIYLLVKGVAKIGMATALYLNQLWAYPLAMALLIVFIGVWLYGYFSTHSLGLLALVFLDFFTLWLTWQEYRRHRLKWDNQKT